MEQYKKEAPFSDGLGEFDQARAVVGDLIAEYEAAEREDYLNPNPTSNAHSSFETTGAGAGAGTGVGVGAGTATGAGVG